MYGHTLDLLQWSLLKMINLYHYLLSRNIKENKNAQS